MTVTQLAHYQNKLAYEMDSWDVFAALQAGEQLVVVDGRGSSAYEKEHIPGSINIPHKEMCVNTTESLDKTKTYVCYCDGIGCNASTKAALKLLTLGFNVRELMGGLDWWKRDGYATAGAEGRPGTELT